MKRFDMKNLLFGFLATSFIAVSCNKKDEKPTYIKDETSTQQPNVAYSQSQTTLMDQAGIKSNTQTGSTMVTAPGMNPPHGQPGHKCEIPVGQPLNGSAPSVQSATQNIQVNGNNTVQIDPSSMKKGNAIPIKTAPGMNPPHGEPGHRCDIPVGQPLSSKPAQAIQSTAVQTSQPVPVSQPAVANTGPKPKLNPAHGEPWHDCAKQVGAPL
ncbi:hypothetical protein [Chryseobacterium sp. GP-SGM7]|uniref:hypothetical protein n=1 Tax=Chryseobacterium sp. GP-SGM7 TaxID=3411323 RepID=UPI003B94C578